MQGFQGHRMVADQAKLPVIQGLFTLRGAKIAQPFQCPCFFTGAG